MVSVEVISFPFVVSDQLLFLSSDRYVVVSTFAGDGSSCLLLFSAAFGRDGRSGSVPVEIFLSTNDDGLVNVQLRRYDSGDSRSFLIAVTTA